MKKILMTALAVTLLSSFSFVGTGFAKEKNPSAHTPVPTGNVVEEGAYKAADPAAEKTDKKALEQQDATKSAVDSQNKQIGSDSFDSKDKETIR